jgi:hypothetical protein
MIELKIKIDGCNVTIEGGGEAAEDEARIGDTIAGMVTNLKPLWESREAHLRYKRRKRTISEEIAGVVFTRRAE